MFVKDFFEKDFHTAVSGFMEQMGKQISLRLTLVDGKSFNVYSLEPMEDCLYLGIYDDNREVSTGVIIPYEVIFHIELLKEPSTRSSMGFKVSSQNQVTT
jgi:hypothetical protein